MGLPACRDARDARTHRDDPAPSLAVTQCRSVPPQASGLGPPTTQVSAAHTAWIQYYSPTSTGGSVLTVRTYYSCLTLPGTLTA